MMVCVLFSILLFVKGGILWRLRSRLQLEHVFSTVRVLDRCLVLQNSLVAQLSFQVFGISFIVLIGGDGGVHE